MANEKNTDKQNEKNANASKGYDPIRSKKEAAVNPQHDIEEAAKKGQPISTDMSKKVQEQGSEGN